ncbi:MAG: hemerythrin domain-containing protein [Alphaproteobacteria bacterium]|nr:hemerythrin domain-containing protein [Alphaproteobacteria bacterium]
MRYGSLRDWLVRHEELERRWEELWVAAPEVDADGFRRGLASLSAALRLHIAQEEATLIPAWEERPDPPANATGAVLRRDHELLLGLLDDLDRCAHERRTRTSGLHRLREVLRHHDAREASSIKPGLDALVDADTVRTWLGRFEREEDALPAAFRFEPGGRGDAEGDEPEDAVVADAPVAERVVAVGVPEHPKGAILHRRALALAEVVDRCDDPRARRLLAADLWGALHLLRIVGSR